MELKSCSTVVMKHDFRYERLNMISIFSGTVIPDFMVDGRLLFFPKARSPTKHHQPNPQTFLTGSHILTRHHDIHHRPTV
jgi:hypothetical protein